MMISDRTLGDVTFDSDYLRTQAVASLDLNTLIDPDSDHDAFISVIIHKVLWLLRYYANTEGGGVITEYELGQLLGPIARELKAQASAEA